MTHLRILALSFAALGTAAGCTASVDTTGPDASLHVQNASDFSIVEIHVTSVGSSTWGPNLISGDVLAPGESMTIDVTCDTYDALLVDSDGVDCQLHSVSLCFNNASWVIQNNTCSVFGAAKAQREAEAKAAGSAAQ